MSRTWWPRSSSRDYNMCSATREADSTAATGLRHIDILSCAPQLCPRYISTIINRSSASSNPTLLTDYTKGSRPTTTPRRAGSLFHYGAMPVCGARALAPQLQEFSGHAHSPPGALELACALAIALGRSWHLRLSPGLLLQSGARGRFQ